MRRGTPPRTPRLARLAAPGATASRRRAAMAVARALLTAFALVAAGAGTAEAQVVRAFAPRYAANANGDVTLIGNTIMSCNGGGGCTNGRNGTGGRIDNNDFTMVYVNADSDPTTFSSSSATLGLPAGATVLWAGLYWGGESANAARNTVRFATPVSGYTTVTAARLDAFSADYQGFADVTNQVRAAGSGTYWVANVYSTPNQSNKHGGWAMVVAYDMASLPMRNLVVFDGYAHINNSTDVTLTVSGFVTPPAGLVNSRLGVVAYEGDLGFTGDNFQLNGVNLGDAVSPGNNFFNSSVSVLGARFTAKTPNYVNQLGFDADLVLSSGILPNGATSATILLTSSGDEYYPGAVVFATDLYAPVFTSAGFTKTVTDLNGGAVYPGDVLEYTATTNNSGQDHAVQCVLRDTLAAGVGYVPGSLQIATGANAGAKSDGAGDDQGEYDAGSRAVIARLGTGADAVNGGQIDIGGTTSVKFRVQVGSVPSGTVIANQAALNFVAAQSGVAFAARSDGDLATPGEQPVVVTTVGGGVAVSGVVYADANHDAARQPAESGIGVTIYAKLVPTGAPSAAQAAAVDPFTGAFSFSGVGAGTYDVVRDDNNSLADIASDDPPDWIGTEAPSGVRAGVVVAGAALTGLDFGLWHGSRVEGAAFRDDGGAGAVANDGARQAGEPGVAAARVRLLSAACAGGACDSALTGASGDYALWLPFATAGAGATVEEVNAAGWLSTGGSPGTTGGAYDRAFDATAFTVAAGVVYSGADFGDVPPNLFVAPGARTASAGGVATYAHTFTAGSGGDVSLSAVQTPSPALPGWTLTLVHDLDCDGVAGAGEPVLSGPVTLVAGQTLCVVARHGAPAGAPSGAQETATLTAGFSYTGASPALGTSVALDDVTTVAPDGLVITKSVDLASARPGDTLNYTITYANLGTQPVSSIVIQDATPPYTTFVSAGCGALGAGLGGCGVAAQPAVGATGAVQWTFAGSLDPGASGSVSFVVQVQ